MKTSVYHLIVSVFMVFGANICSAQEGPSSLLLDIQFTHSFTESRFDRYDPLDLKPFSETIRENRLKSQPFLKDKVNISPNLNFTSNLPNPSRLLAYVGTGILLIWGIMILEEGSIDTTPSGIRATLIVGGGLGLLAYIGEAIVG